MREVEKAVLLRNMDMLWMEHLENMDHLKDSVRLRAYGQKDPLVEYKNEGWRLFKRLLEDIQFSVINTIFKVQLAQPSATSQAVKAGPLNVGQGPAFNDKKADLPAETRGAKVGRNDPCPCGSGRKYKKCCLAKQAS